MCRSQQLKKIGKRCGKSRLAIGSDAITRVWADGVSVADATAGVATSVGQSSTWADALEMENVSNVSE